MANELTFNGAIATAEQIVIARETLGITTALSNAPRPLFDWNANDVAPLANGAPVFALPDSAGKGVPAIGSDAARRPTKGTDASGKSYVRFAATAGNGQKLVAETLGVSEPALKVPRGAGTLMIVVAPDDLASQPNTDPVLIQGAGSNPPRLAILSNGGVIFAGSAAGVNVTSDTTNNSKILRNLSGDVLRGARLTAAGIPAGAYLESTDGASGIMSVAATATATGVAITIGGTSNNTRQFMPSVADGTKHIITIVDDGVQSSLYVDNYFVSTINGSFFGPGLTTPTVGVGSSTSGNAGAFLSMNLYRVTCWREALSQTELAAEHARRNSEHACGLNLQSATADGYQYFVDSTTSDGSAVRIFPPSRPAADPVLVLWCHPSGADRNITSTYFAYPYVRAAVGMGWHFAASDMGFAAAPGGQTRTWGNATAQNALLLLYQKVLTDYGLPSDTKVILLGASMGGKAALDAIARQTLPAGVVKAAYIIDGAVSLFDMYKTAYYSEIDAAFAVASGTLSGAAAQGVNSLPSTANYAAGTQIVVGGGTAGAEKVVVGPGGSTGSAIPITTNLVNAHAAGERVSDMPEKAAGYDPLIAANANFQSLPIRFTASDSDVLVPIAPNSQAMKAKLADVAVDVGLLKHLLGHLAGGATNARDFVDFLYRNEVV